MEGQEAAHDGAHDLAKAKSLAFQDNLEQKDEIAEESEDNRFLRYHEVLGKGVRFLRAEGIAPLALHVT